MIHADSGRPGAATAALLLVVWAVSAALAAPRPVAGQAADHACRPYDDAGVVGWDGARVRRIVDEAVTERMHAFSDTTLRAFDAYAEGHVDFLIDLGDFGGERTVRTDRLALELQWVRGRGSLQTLIGRRTVSWAPTRIHYHTDHLSLVMENFGRTIEVGEGDEVSDVLHPIAPGATGFYQYRLVDSLTVMIGPHTSKVYRIQVRPACRDDPGVIGTLDMDFETLAIARLTATFTPSAYVDPTVSRINISLVNGWVNRRWWLPVRQSVEVRRSVEWLDIPFGTTIRTSFEILDYDLEPEAHGRLRREHRVASLAPQELERYAGWRREEMRVTADHAPLEEAHFDAIRREAVSIAANRYLGGGARFRFFLPNASSGLRYRRAEGVLLGGGVSWRPAGRTVLYGWVGYPFAHATPEAVLVLRQELGKATVKLDGFVERHSDVGPFTAASGIVSSFGAGFRGDDYLDPYFRDGVSASVTAPIGSWTATGGVAWEEQRSAELVAGAVGSVEPRPVRSVTDGTELRLDFEIQSRLGTAAAAAWTVAVTSQLAGGADFRYTRWIASFEAAPPDPDAVWQWEAAGAIALATGTTPEQRLFLIGGRGTVPGYSFRPWGGDQAAYALVAISREVASPWLRLRILGAAGWSEVTMVSREAAERFGVTGTARIKTSLGAGVALFWDLVRLDAAHGLDDGEWEWMVSVKPTWRAPL